MPHGTDARLDEAYGLLESGAVTLLSLDVFDTLVFRTVPEPVDVFGLVGLRLAEHGALRSHVSPAVFSVLRREAEQRARDRRGTGAEVTMLDIYVELAAVLSPAAGPERAIKLELEAERDRLLPDLDMVALVEFARARGIPVVCVSDTYLTEAELRAYVLGQLPEHDRPFARVFVSSAYHRGKGSGLFSTVLRDMGVQAADVLHVGDNRDSDVGAPRRLGIHAVHYERRPHALEVVVAREHGHRDAGDRPSGVFDYGLTALRAKALNRRERAELPATLRGHWEYGAGSLGPAFAGFAEWVVERAAQEGIGVAHCLMREGQLLVPMIEAAAAAAGRPLEARRLWLSRQICARATLFDGTRGEIAQLLERRRQPTVAELLGWLGIAPDGAGALAPHLGRRLIDPRLADRVLDELSTDPELHGQVVANSAALRRRVLVHLEETVALSEGRLLLVDLGWGATIQHLLRRLLAHAGVEFEMLGLYLVTHSGVRGRLLDGTAAEGFLGEAGLPVGPVDALIRSPEILEQVCMPDHGSQVDLDVDGQPVVPEPRRVTIQDAERDAAQRGILAFQRQWIAYRTGVPGRISPLWQGAQGQLLAMLVRATAAPTADEAALLAGWLHDDNFGSSAEEAMTGGPSVRAVRHIDARGLLGIPMSELYWPFGLAALHDEQLAKAAELTALGLVDWRAFASEVETGPFECFADAGGGFGAGPIGTGDVRRNRFGLSHVRAVLKGHGIRAVRFDPVAAASIVRLDWLTLRIWRSGAAEPDTVRVDEQTGFDRLRLANAGWLGTGVILSQCGDPQLVLDLGKEGRDAYQVELEVGFAVLPLLGRLKPTSREPLLALQAPASSVAIGTEAERVLRGGVRRALRLLSRARPRALRR